MTENNGKLDLSAIELVLNRIKWRRLDYYKTNEGEREFSRLYARSRVLFYAKHRFYPTGFIEHYLLTGGHVADEVISYTRIQKRLEQIRDNEKKATAMTKSTKVTPSFSNPVLTAADIWVQKQVSDAAAAGAVTSITITLTPDIAEALLRRNPSNRPMDKTGSSPATQRIIREVEAGRWELNGTSIVVSDTGELNDGQNRCLAVKITGVGIQTVITFGVSRSSRLTVDQTTVRTGAHLLTMTGVANPVNTAAVANALAAFHHTKTFLLNNMTTKATVSRSTLPQIVSENPDIVRSVAFVGNRCGRLFNLRALTTCHVLFSRRGGNSAADSFVNSALSGAGLSEDDPILLARNKIITLRSGPVLSYASNAEARIWFIAWNLVREGRKQKRINLPKGSSDEDPLPDLI